jgi:hypothetical protein
MKQDITALHYPADGNKRIEYDQNVMFPINGVLARTLRKNEQVKVIRLMNSSGMSSENAQKMEAELQTINKNIEAFISFEDAIEDFIEDKKTLESRFRQLITFLEPDTDIIADITYGQKTLPLVLFSVLAFAEKFFNADIRHIVYGKVEFENGKPKAGTQMLYDITPQYYLHSLVSAMEAPDGKSAVKIINNFFNL